MKKALFFIAMIFALLVSCEKEDPMKLSEYVLGNWDSQNFMDGETPVWYHVLIDEDNTYYLSITNGEMSVNFDPAEYTVDDSKDQISIQEPNFPDDQNPDTKSASIEEPSWITFDVIWTEDGKTMTWNPVGQVDTDAPVLIWTRDSDD